MATFNDTITQDITLSFSGTGIINNILAEDITLDDILSEEQIHQLLEKISLATVVLTDGSTFHDSLQDLFEVSDEILLVYSFLVSEDLTVDDVLDNYKLFQNIITEILESSDIAGSTASHNLVLAVSLVLSELLTDLNEIVIENLSIDEQLIESIIALEALLDQAELQDSINNTLSLFTVSIEDISLEDAILTSASLHSLIKDSVLLKIGSTLRGIDYEGWVLNPRTSAVWNYNNYDFNSMADYNEQYLFASDQGLFKLGGVWDDLEEIISSIKFASVKLAGTQHQAPEILLGLIQDGRLVLKVTVDQGQTVYYELKVSTKQMETRQIKIGKGLYSRYWQFELITKDNSQLELDTFEVLPIAFGRKVR